MGLFDKVKEAGDKKNQAQFEKFKITELRDIEIKAMAEDVVTRNANDDYITAGIQREINGSPLKSSALLLRTIQEQNWIIIRQLDKIATLLSEKNS